MYNPTDGKSAIKSLGIELPRYVRGLSYYDFIGNISTSTARRDDDKVSLQLDPRFPIFGQWNTDFNL
jgi:oligosaccharyltransferase complex subunit alpha (ribophorin I)